MDYFKRLNSASTSLEDSFDGAMSIMANYEPWIGP